MAKILDTKIFTVDEANSDDEYLWVDVFGMGTVMIKAEDEGIVVDIFPFHIVDNPVASTWATMDMLVEKVSP